MKELIEKAMIETAAWLWFGEELPVWYENEYLRGQVELLSDLSDFGIEDGDARKYEVAFLIRQKLKELNTKRREQ